MERGTRKGDLHDFCIFFLMGFWERNLLLEKVFPGRDFHRVMEESNGELLACVAMVMKNRDT